MVKFERIEVVVNDKGERIALARNGEVMIVGPKGTAIESYAVPNGALLMVEDGQTVEPGKVICQAGSRTSRRSCPTAAARCVSTISWRAKRCARSATRRPAPSAASSWSTRANCTRRSSSRTNAASP